MSKINWTAVVVFGLVVLIVLLLGLGLLGWFSGHGYAWPMGGMMRGWGMRGGWGFWPLGWLFMAAMMLSPLVLLALLVLGVVWLVRAVAPPAAPAAKVCPSCHRPAQADWQVCPYCGAKLS
jgi:hypothetical protein